LISKNKNQNLPGKTSTCGAALLQFENAPNPVKTKIIMEIEKEELEINTIRRDIADIDLEQQQAEAKLKLDKEFNKGKVR
jgi:hypothetical protein